MKLRGLLGRADRRGFTLAETTVSLGVFLVLSYALVVTLDMASDSQSAVTVRSAEVRSARSTHSTFADELREADSEDVVIETLEDGNHQVSLRQPIEVAGAAAWGVFDRSLGTTDDERNREDWRVRYTVALAQENGVAVRRLVRQIVDEDGAVQRERVLQSGLLSGLGARPGFQVARVGDVWRVQIASQQHGSTSIRGEDFHVGIRN